MSLEPQFGTLGSIERTTRREQILDLLRAAVSSGDLAPGTHLAETELSAQLGVSRGTLREALRHLQEDGLLTKDSRGRLSVRIVSPEEVSDIFDVRYALESMAITVIGTRPEQDQIAAALRAALENLRRSEQLSVPEQVAADLAFHEVICQASGNQTLVDSWRRVSGLSRAMITAAGRETARANMSAARHEPILDAIVAGDSEGALEVLREHNRIAKNRILTQLNANA